MIDRIVNVPDGMTSEQQVQIGNQILADVTKLTQPTTNATSTQSSSTTTISKTQNECTLLDSRITHLDSLARQPQSGAMQDWITAERRKARDRQFRIRCR